MAYLLKQNGKVDYNYKEYYLDTKQELDEINTKYCCPGSISYDIETGDTYILNNAKEWKVIKVNEGGSGGETPASDGLIIAFAPTFYSKGTNSENSNLYLQGESSLDLSIAMNSGSMGTNLPPVKSGSLGFMSQGVGPIFLSELYNNLNHINSIDEDIYVTANYIETPYKISFGTFVIDEQHNFSNPDYDMYKNFYIKKFDYPDKIIPTTPNTLSGPVSNKEDCSIVLTAKELKELSNLVKQEQNRLCDALIIFTSVKVPTVEKTISIRNIATRETSASYPIPLELGFLEEDGTYSNVFSVAAGEAIEKTFTIEQLSKLYITNLSHIGDHTDICTIEFMEKNNGQFVAGIDYKIGRNQTNVKVPVCSILTDINKIMDITKKEEENNDFTVPNFSEINGVSYDSSTGSLLRFLSLSNPEITILANYIEAV